MVGYNHHVVICITEYSDLYLDIEAYEMLVWVTCKPNRVYIVLARVMKTIYYP